MPKRYMQISVPNPWLGQKYDEVYDEVVEAIKVGLAVSDPEMDYNIEDIVNLAYAYRYETEYYPKVNIIDFWDIVRNQKKEQY